MLNVVVEESLRGNGIGTALMAAATDMAVQQWQAERMYTHVDCHNEARTVGNLMLQQLACHTTQYTCVARSADRNAACLQGACNLYYNVCGYDVCNDLKWTPAPGEELCDGCLPCMYAIAPITAECHAAPQARGFCLCENLV